VCNSAVDSAAAILVDFSGFLVRGGGLRSVNLRGCPTKTPKILWDIH
jgi:hypothetical protein